MSYRKKTFSKKAVVLTVIAAVLLLAAVVSTVAYIMTNTDPLKNTFTPTKVGCKVLETFDTEINEKKSVKIQNYEGNIDAYVRAAIVITWQDKNGNVYGGKVPVKDTDYTITQTANGWTYNEDDGYWYFNSPVKPDEATAVLIDSIKPKDTAPEGYTLSVEILAQSIQAEPDYVIETVWGYEPVEPSAE